MGERLFTFRRLVRLYFPQGGKFRFVTFWPLCKEWVDSRNACCAGTGDALHHFGLIECGMEGFETFPANSSDASLLLNSATSAAKMYATDAQA
jgi:hypothetical protein